MLRAFALCCAITLPLLAGASDAPDAPGPVFVIRASNGGSVENAANGLSALPGGGFVAVTGAFLAAGPSVFGYLYDANGNRVGGARGLLVANSSQNFTGPVVATDPNGNFAVAATQSLSAQPGVTPMYGRLYRADGSLVTSFTSAGSGILNSRVTGIAMSPSGAFVVSGEETDAGGVCNGSSEATGGAWIAFYSAAGALQHALCAQSNLGPGDTTSDANISYLSPHVGMDAQGRVVLLMVQRVLPVNPSNARSQSLDNVAYNADATLRPSGGVNIGGDNIIGLDSPQGFSLAVDPTGAFVVGWMQCGSNSAGNCGDPYSVHAERHDSNGNLIHAAIIGGNASDPPLVSPSVASDASGRFVLSWQRQDDSSVHAQRFDTQVQPLDTAFDLGSGPAGTANSPALTALDASGDLVAMWNQQLAGAKVNTVGRRFAGTDSVDLALNAISHPVKAQPGGALSYVFSVGNTQAASTPTGIPAIDAAIGSASTVSIVDTLPPGAAFSGASGDNWSCAASAGAVTCNYGLLLPAVHTTSQLTLNLTASQNAGTGTPSNQATVTALQYDANFANNSVKQPFKVLGIGVSPVSYDFPPRDLNQTSPVVNFTLGNYGSAAVAITSIAIDGDFAQSNACPASLAVNQKCTIAVTFMPTALGARSGTLTINGGAVVVPLTGSGVNPGHPPYALTATPGFGRVTLNWSGTADAVSYNIYQGTSASGEGLAPVRTGVKTTSTTISGLSNTSTYYFKVSAVNASGESAKSNEAHATPQ